jgi:CheY-specific phosphatase CheX
VFVSNGSDCVAGKSDRNLKHRRIPSLGVGIATGFITDIEGSVGLSMLEETTTYILLLLG